MTQEEERGHVHSGRGKWSQPGVPHKGWECESVEDLGEPQLTCEMCESQEIRYVHHMAHPNYVDVLKVGCVCAGHMEEDLAAARSREASMKGRAGKRKRWLSRKWKTSQQGNHWIEADGYRVTVYRKASGWGATVASVVGSYERHSKRFYATREDAKLASFDLISSLLSVNG